MIERKSQTMFSKQPACSHRWVCWYTISHGGKLLGIILHGAPARTIQRNALNISRSSYRRCGASSLIRTRYGAAKLHSSSDTSVGYGLRSGIAPGYQVWPKVPNTL